MKNMLTFSSKLYLGEGIKAEKLDKIKKKLIYKPVWANVYVIAFAHNPGDQLEIFDARQMVQHYYQNNPTEIVGIAKDYDDALVLIKKITQQCLSERGDCKLKEYLIC